MWLMDVFESQKMEPKAKCTSNLCHYIEIERVLYFISVYAPIECQNEYLI